MHRRVALVAAGLGMLVSQRAVVLVGRRVVGGPIVVVPDGHAHARRDGGRALYRNADGQHRDSHETNEGAEHRLELYVSPWTAAVGAGFRRMAHILRCERSHVRGGPMPASQTSHAPVDKGAHPQRTRHYRRLLVMTALSFVAMYVLMYAMVDSLGDVFNSVNQIYMAGLMAATMVLIELGLMGAMYRHRKLNAAIAALSAVALVACWGLIRTQGAVGDRQFVRSMIPHHSGAILMCREAPISDPEIRRLCGKIIESQQSEIEQMRDILARLE